MEQSSPQPTSKGPADRFVGDVFVDPIVSHPGAGFSVATVRFAPGSYNAWHSHAAGQVLHCTDGLGVVVTDEEVIVLRPGVTVWTPPGQRHWHGAAPDRFMTHLAMSAVVTLPDGQPAAAWGEFPGEAAYAAATADLATTDPTVIPGSTRDPRTEREN